MDDLKARTLLLDETQWANEFAWSEMQSIAAYLRVDQRAKGSFVCREGEVEPSLFVIAKGSVAIVKHDAAEHGKVVATLGPGQTIGEMALLDGQPRSASVVAAEDLVLLVFTRAALEHLVEEKPSLAVKVLWKLARVLSQRLRQTSGALVERLE